MNNNLEIALTKSACPLCGKSENDTIIMNTLLTEKMANEVKKLHGQTIGYMNKPCKECQSDMEKSFLLIGIIEEKTEDESNPYRGGNIWVIKNEVAQKFFNDISKGAAFIDIKAAISIGLPISSI